MDKKDAEEAEYSCEIIPDLLRWGFYFAGLTMIFYCSTEMMNRRFLHNSFFVRLNLFFIKSILRVSRKNLKR